MKALLPLVLCCLPALAAAKTIPYAIVIGNNAPPSEESGLLPLRYADDDAVRYHHLFRGLDADTRLLTVLDSETQRRHPALAASTLPPTLANLLAAVDDFVRKMEADRKRGDMPVFYLTFSGHGVRPEQGAPFLALIDGEITQELLAKRILAKLPARYSHLLIDACHAGGVVGVRGSLFAQEVDAHTVAVKPREVAAALDTQSILHIPTVGVLLATTSGQEAHEWSQYQGGVFTHEVISGLLGAADVNGDHKIEYSELHAFVAAANRDLADPRALPHVVAQPPAADQNAPLINLDQMHHATLLSGRFASLGAFHIELANGLRYLDAHLGADLLTTLVLPKGGRALLLSPDAEAELILDGKPITVERLSRKRPETTSRGALELTYRSGLFASEFSIGYYRGFVDSSGALGVSFERPEIAMNERRSAVYRRPLASALFTTAGVLTAACIITTIDLALQVRPDFDRMQLPQAASGASERLTNDLGAAIGTGIGALLTGVAGALLWPRGARRSALVGSANGLYPQFSW